MRIAPPLSIGVIIAPLLPRPQLTPATAQHREGAEGGVREGGGNEGDDDDDDGRGGGGD